MKFKTRYQKLRDAALRKNPYADGIYIYDHENRQEVFVTFDELHMMCKGAQDVPDFMSEAVLGKPPYKDDPSYNWRRKRDKV